jgi:hypothetical protein
MLSEAFQLIEVDLLSELQLMDIYSVDASKLCVVRLVT